MKNFGALFKGVDHALYRLVEDQPDQALQHLIAELEIDKKIDFASIGMGPEYPMIVEIAKRTVAIGDINARFVRGQGDFGGKTLADQLKADDEIGGNGLRLARFYPRADAPGQKIRIALYIGDQIK